MRKYLGRDGHTVTSTLRVCNQGRQSFNVSTVRFYKGTLFNPEGHELIAEGWWTVEPGSCSDVYSDDWSNYVFLGFMQRDASGSPQGAVFTLQGQMFSSPYGYQNANRSFCVKMQKFAYRGTAKNLSEDCAQDASYMMLPYSVLFQTDERSGTYTLNLNLEQNARLVPLRSGGGAAPTTSAPARAPKPGEEGTRNATFLGRRVVRWLTGGGRWYWEDGKPLDEGLNLTGKSFSVLFDPQPMYDRVPEAVDRNIDTILQTQEAGTKLGVTPSGTLVLTSPDGMVKRTNFLALDLDNARTTDGALHPFVFANCRGDGRENECVISVASDGMLSVSTSLTLDVKNPTDGQLVVSALRALAGLFKGATYNVETVTGPPEP